MNKYKKTILDNDIEGYEKHTNLVNVIIFIVIALSLVIGLSWAFSATAVSKPRIDTKASQTSVQTSVYRFPDPCTLEDVVCSHEPKTIYATITGYNSVKSQTDRTPCLGAGGTICNKSGVVACPRYIQLKILVRIDGQTYKCLDRLSKKYDNRFDIFFDKDIKAAKAWGIQRKEITIL